MNILSIGSDRSVLDRYSVSAQRQCAYGAHFDSWRIIVFTRSRERCRPITLAPGVHATPTNSISKLTYGLDACMLGLRGERPDVISVQDPFEAGLVGLILSLVRRSELHVQVHTDVFAPAFREHSWINALRVRMARVVLRRASRIRVVSARIQKGIEAEGIQVPITVLPIYTPREKFAHAQAGELRKRFAAFETIFLVVSRLESEKNIHRALRSFIDAHIPRSCLVIVGDGSQRYMLESVAQNSQVASAIFFEGRQDPLPYYALASLVLVPSKYEGYGNVIVEALAAGKPVLATDVGIAKEAGAILTDEGHFTEALRDWVASGPRTAALDLPPITFDEYVRTYVDDIAQSKKLAIDPK